MQLDEIQKVYQDKIVEYIAHGKRYTGRVYLVMECDSPQKTIVLFIHGGGAKFLSEITAVISEDDSQ